MSNKRLARFYSRKVFRRRKNEKKREKLSNLLAFVTVLLVIVLVVLVILPQLIDSVVTFAKNLDGYMASFEGMLNQWGLSDKLGLDGGGWEEMTRNVMDTVLSYLTNNLTDILSKTATTGKALIQLAIAIILSVYLLAEKSRLKAGSKRLLKGLLSQKRYDAVTAFLRRCSSPHVGDAVCRHRYFIFFLTWAPVRIIMAKTI